MISTRVIDRQIDRREIISLNKTTLEAKVNYSSLLDEEEEINKQTPTEK